MRGEDVGLEVEALDNRLCRRLVPGSALLRRIRVHAGDLVGECLIVLCLEEHQARPGSAIRQIAARVELADRRLQVGYQNRPPSTDGDIVVLVRMLA